MRLTATLVLLSASRSPPPTATGSPTSTSATRTTRTAPSRSSSPRSGSASRASRPSSSWPSTTCADTRSGRPSCGRSWSGSRRSTAGRPVSIMTCKIDPDDPHLQTWLKEGLSLEVHTVDHPCPLLPRATSPRPNRPTTAASIRWPRSRTTAGRVPDAVLRLAQHRQPAVLRRDLQQDDREGQLPPDRQLGLQRLHAERPRPAARAG